MVTEQLSLEITPAQEWEQEAARRALDGLFSLARKYNSSPAYLELMKFTAKFRFYAPFNALLVHIQMPGATFVAPPDRWLYHYGRTIKLDARPLVILQPMGPVMFVFDVSETEPMKGAPDLPSDVLYPFRTTERDVSYELERTRDNAIRDGIEIYTQEAGAQYAGSIRIIATDRQLMFQVKQRPKPEYVPVKVCYAIMLNREHSPTTRYTSLVHELAHLYCGHLGTPNDRWWPDRRGLPHSIREFEAESVSYLVCSRLGIDTPSAAYLAGYCDSNQETPPISLDCIMKAAGLIESMGRERLPARKEKAL